MSGIEGAELLVSDRPALEILLVPPRGALPEAESLMQVLPDARHWGERAVEIEQHRPVLPDHCSSWVSCGSLNAPALYASAKAPTTRRSKARSASSNRRAIALSNDI